MLKCRGAETTAQSTTLIHARVVSSNPLPIWVLGLRHHNDHEMESLGHWVMATSIHMPGSFGPESDPSQLPLSPDMNALFLSSPINILSLPAHDVPGLELEHKQSC